MLLVKLIEPPCTEPYARWCERSKFLIYEKFLLLDSMSPRKRLRRFLGNKMMLRISFQSGLEPRLNQRFPPPSLRYEVGEICILLYYHPYFFRETGEGYMIIPAYNFSVCMDSHWPVSFYLYCPSCYLIDVLVFNMASVKDAWHKP